MAYKIINYAYVGVAGAPPKITAVLDSADDLEGLKASGEYHPGSIAYVAEEGLPAYMVNASGEWVEV
jgi:hypothetical protein